MAVLKAHETKKVHFRGDKKDDFLLEIKKRVDDHFLQTKISKNGNFTLYVKGLILGSSCLFLWCCLMFGWMPDVPRLFLWILIGCNQVLVSMNVGHDAVHGAYSKSARVNQFLGFITYDLLGFSSWVWKQTHNQGHHTYTNISGHDPDIHKPGLLRLSPHEPVNKAHPYQHYYIWVLYGLVGMNWMLYGDYAYAWKERSKISLKELALLLLFKAANLSLFIFLPLFFSPLSPEQLAAGYVAMQVAGGLLAALVFQLAHIVEEVAFPLPDAEGVIGKPWGSHEMETTANFATQNKLITYLFGGLNFQIEHHLFPKISHVHYPQISPILKSTAKKYGLPYFEQPSFFSAVASHYRVLKCFGQATLSDPQSQR